MCEDTTLGEYTQGILRSWLQGTGGSMWEGQGEGGGGAGGRQSRIIIGSTVGCLGKLGLVPESHGNPPAENREDVEGKRERKMLL